MAAGAESAYRRVIRCRSSFLSRIRELLVGSLQMSQAALIGLTLSRSCETRAQFGKGHTLDLGDAAFVNA